jgi:hypothetical protein
MAMAMSKLILYNADMLYIPEEQVSRTGLKIMAPTPRSLLVVFLSTIPVVFCTSLHSKPLNLTEGQINAVTDCLTEAAQQRYVDYYLQV